MRVLGIETSTEVCSVGLVGADGLRSERSLLEKHIHSEKLITLLQEVVREASSPLATLDGVAVSIGPGSFTGLRIGLSAAKGLCFSLNIPLVAVSTFHAFALAAKKEHPRVGNILVALDAKKGDFYAAVLSVDGPMPMETTVVHAEKLQQLGHDDVDLVITDKPDLLRMVVPGVPTEKVHQYARGSVVAEIGSVLLGKGHVTDVRSIEPAYLKDFVVKKAQAG